MAAVTARLEVQVRPEIKSRIEYAAGLVHVPVSDFVRNAVEQRADRVIADHEVAPPMPASFYDDLLGALDAPVSPSPALACAPAAPPLRSPRTESRPSTPSPSTRPATT